MNNNEYNVTWDENNISNNNNSINEEKNNNINRNDWMKEVKTKSPKIFVLKTYQSYKNTDAQDIGNKTARHFLQY